ncbi:MAG: superfamily I DNA/RNA helicase [Phenylobacterium sp.]|jgi:superfamily I DNA/RNA helicase
MGHIDLFNRSLMTMHAAKGTEYDVCFVVDPRFAQFYPDSKDDHLRLHYVALTRAKRELYICKTMTGDAGFSDAKGGDVHVLDFVSETQFVDYYES